MNSNNRQNENLFENFDATEEEVYNALIDLGWLLPRTEEELCRAEKALETVECPPFPPELEDPAPLIERLRKEQEGNSKSDPHDNQKAKTALRLVANNQAVSESSEDDAPSFPVLLRRIVPNETPSVVAGKLGVNVGFLKLVSDHREFIPDSWCDELAKEAKNVYSIDESRSRRTLKERPTYQQQIAASRAVPYSNRKMDWREILQKSNLEPEREAHYRHLAEEEEEKRK